MPTPPPSRFWALAASFGALWGAVEITLGSFLHTLKVPFGGALLASLGAALLVAQRQIEPTRGLSVATAAIAALCKSLSPGGVILGPMIGIGVEGLLVELALFVAPRFFGSALLAGTLAALWSAFQKVLVQLVLYGGTALELYEAALRKADDWLGHGGAGLGLVAALLSILGALGMLAGGFGHRVGREAARVLREEA